MSERNVYQALMIAAARGKGLRITAEEAHALAMDGAIETVANNSLSGEDFNGLESSNHWDFWRKFAKRRVATMEGRDNITNTGSKSDLHPEYVTAENGTDHGEKSTLHPGFVPPEGGR